MECDDDIELPGIFDLIRVNIARFIDNRVQVKLNGNMMNRHMENSIYHTVFCVRYMVIVALGLSLAVLLACGCSKESTQEGVPGETTEIPVQTIDTPAQTPDTSEQPVSDAARSVEEPEKAAPRISVKALHDAAYTGGIETVRQAIAQGADVNASDADGRIALQLAAFEGHTEVVQLLLDNGAQLDHLDSAGRTALLYASSGPNPETVLVLLGAGADTNIVDKVEKFSALMFAAAEGQLEVVRALLQYKADTTLKDIDGDTARDFAYAKRT